MPEPGGYLYVPAGYRARRPAPLAVLLAACGAPREQTMEERHVPGLFTRSTAEMGVISTGGAHRVVTFRVNPEPANGQPAGAFCAEPPPDAPVLDAGQRAALLAAAHAKLGADALAPVLQQLLPSLRCGGCEGGGAG